VRDLRFWWGELADASPAPEEGEFFGMALDIDPAESQLVYQTLSTGTDVSACFL